jgi:hypothetical protein
MTKQKRDPLLTALKVIVYIIMALMAFAAIIAFLAAPFALIAQGEILAEIAAKGIDEPGWLIISSLAGVLIGFAAMFALGIYFFRLLLRIADTVREEDPFTPDNAKRLSLMGWAAVAAHVLAALISIPGSWLASLAERTGETVNFSADVGGGGLITILVLFMLARVFKHGAAMREDLEGTV